MRDRIDADGAKTTEREGQNEKKLTHMDDGKESVICSSKLNEMQQRED